MEHRFLGRSGFKIPALGFGTGTFGGQGPLFSAWGNTDVAGARHIAINWLLQRPTVASVLIGARDEAQLTQNLGAIGWQLDAAQLARLDKAGAVTPPNPYYPYWNGQFAERGPIAIGQG